VINILKAKLNDDKRDRAGIVRHFASSQDS